MKKMRSRKTTSMRGAMSSWPFSIWVRRLSRLNLMLVSLLAKDVEQIRGASFHLQHETVDAAHEVIVSDISRNGHAETENRRQKRFPNAPCQVARIDGAHYGRL